MASTRVSRALPILLVLKGLITNFLIVVVLLWAFSAFKYPRVAGLSRGIEVALP
jgi:hypothetical protein